MRKPPENLHDQRDGDVTQDLGTFRQRLETLRADLERVSTELRCLIAMRFASGEAPGPSLLEEVRIAISYVENAADFLSSDPHADE